MSDPRDIETTLRDLRKDLSFAQAKLTTALELVARLPLPPAGDRSSCPLCGVQRNADALPDHMANVHGVEPNVALSAPHTP